MYRFFILLSILTLLTYPLTIPSLADGPGSIPTAPEATQTPGRLLPTVEPVLYKVYIPYFVNGGTDGRDWPLPY